MQLWSPGRKTQRQHQKSSVKLRSQHISYYFITACTSRARQTASFRHPPEDSSSLPYPSSVSSNVWDVLTAWMGPGSKIISMLILEFCSSADKSNKKPSSWSMKGCLFPASYSSRLLWARTRLHQVDAKPWADSAQIFQLKLVEPWKFLQAKLQRKSLKDLFLLVAWMTKAHQVLVK